MHWKGKPEARNGHSANGEHRTRLCGDRQAYQKSITFSAFGGISGGEVVRRAVGLETRQNPLFSQ